MSRDNIRPSESQIHHHYACQTCGSEVEEESWLAAPIMCRCGGLYSFSGESYPASSEEWGEERDDYYSPWRDRR